MTGQLALPFPDPIPGRKRHVANVPIAIGAVL
jgi:hypothetical protein